MKALQIPVTLFIHATTFPLTEGFEVATADMTSFRGYVLLETRQIHIDVNQPEPIDIIGKQVEVLQLEKARLADATYKRIAEIDDQVQQLLCIEHCPIEADELPY
ncbi:MULTISPECIES: hypothetical protein [Serratia]|uniref:Uncharacterized protein n=1 Tax=Serratia marcescens TaxID=615 RepID=A0ABD5BKV6_SERMA|nr:hypothetical protein [Serratia marcescens]MDQ9395344.1 hypothetical protein [Serratia marcescens]MDQ9408005.1 hypothetical protein [Serratia marcescens]MDQ9497897.1 hypothetical protein [Serratia marcescens]MDQ9503074.1 hypothetical protein [Serratia marcescens]MDQ9508485.1 hypothetical protein [Serratia marcescens]